MIGAIYAHLTTRRQREKAGGVLEVTYRVGSLGPWSMVTAWTSTRLPSVCSLAIRSASSRMSANPIQRQGTHSSLHAEAMATRSIAHRECERNSTRRVGYSAGGGGGGRR
jgi:hypothetical protein